MLGVAISWSKNITNIVKPIDTKARDFYVKLKIDDNINILLFACSMPFDNYKQYDVDLHL